MRADKPIDGSPKRDIGGSLSLRFHAAIQVIRHAGQVLGPEEIVHLESRQDDFNLSPFWERPGEDDSIPLYSELDPATGVV
jgi:hypothetical protein